jgi:hypothetical protein
MDPGKLSFSHMSQHQLQGAIEEAGGPHATRVTQLQAGIKPGAGGGAGLSDCDGCSMGAAHAHLCCKSQQSHDSCRRLCMSTLTLEGREQQVVALPVGLGGLQHRGGRSQLDGVTCRHSQQLQGVANLPKYWRADTQCW